ncbi:MAG: helix-turn-helix domain-containing protein, partial [Eubacteriales bacterium]|nr:helix-turn-helix domain-containing protein [Eubacteriales bacterium]
FETTEDILMHLLDGGFPSASYFRLQTVGTYLADFHPSAFALMDLTAYHSQYPGVHHLKEEIGERFPDSHPFLYKGDVFLFLHRESDAEIFTELAKEFDLKVIVSETIRDLYDLPSLYRAAHDALDMIVGSNYHGENVCSVAQLRTPLLLKNLESRNDLISPELRALDEHDRKKETQYCETLYFYLIYSRSLKKTCDALFTHRNTVLYRIERIRNDFLIPLDDPKSHAELLFGVALLLFQKEGPDFFLRIMTQTDDE